MSLRLSQWLENQEREHSSDLVNKLQNWLNTLSDQQLIELLMTGFIPETYEENGEDEKAFTKLMEVLISEIFSRLGFHSELIKAKSGNEDIQIHNDQKAILIDVKTFRLGRSQIAPNVKDFVKLHTFENWIENYNQKHSIQAIGGAVVYPSTHEWMKKSQVYKECSNERVPILMISYEVLAYLLQNKSSFTPSQLFTLWNYSNHFPKPVQARQIYWSVIYQILSKIIKGSEEDLLEELQNLQIYYKETVKETLCCLSTTIQKISNEISQTISNMSDKEARTLLEYHLIHSKSNVLQKSIKNIQTNRKSFLKIDEMN